MVMMMMMMMMMTPIVGAVKNDYYSDGYFTMIMIVIVVVIICQVAGCVFVCCHLQRRALRSHGKVKLFVAQWAPMRMLCLNRHCMKYSSLLMCVCVSGCSILGYTRSVCVCVHVHACASIYF